MNAPSRLLIAAQLGNLLAFGAIGIQMLFVPVLTGWLVIDYFPLAGIAFSIVAGILLGIHYSSHPLGRLVLFLIDFLCMVMYVYWGIVFAGPFARVLQMLFVTFLCIDIAAMAANVPILVASIRDGTLAASFALKGTGPAPARETSVRRKRGILLAACVLASIMFGVLATFNFGYTYLVKAPDDATTRSSFWGPPRYERALVTGTIAPVNNATLLISNATLGTTHENLCNGSIMHVVNVTHSSAPGTNFCNYNAGAESYPNGTVFLSQQLPPGNASISFYYMKNVKALAYLNQTGSRIIHAMWGGDGQNMSWYESPNAFHAITATCEFQLLEHWHIPYFINIGLSNFPHVFNYIPYTERGKAMLEWINASTPRLDHCLGISFDFEKDNFTDPVANPQRPDMGENPFPDVVGDKGWFQRNEQSTEVLRAAKAAYFEVYDIAASMNRSVYVVYQYSALEDYAEGDIDITRLPIWTHPACEYGMMSYQDHHSGGEENAYWEIYRNTRNQLAVYGEQGTSILTGWIDANPASVYSDYYTNDEAGFQRYVEHVKVHQACGISEIFHAALMSLQAKWGDEAILRVHEALNADPKETFTFQATPWSSFDEMLLDIVKNFNNPVLAMPFEAAIIFSLLAIPLLPASRPRNAREPGKREDVSAAASPARCT